MMLIGYLMPQGMPAKFPISEGQCVAAFLFNPAFHQFVADHAHAAGTDICLINIGLLAVLAHRFPLLLLNNYLSKMERQTCDSSRFLTEP